MPLPLSLQAEPSSPPRLCSPHVGLRSRSCIQRGHSQPDTGRYLLGLQVISSHSTKFVGLISDSGPKGIWKNFVVRGPSSQPLSVGAYSAQ